MRLLMLCLFSSLLLFQAIEIPSFQKLNFGDRQFKKEEPPIAYCSAENFFLLDKWMIAKECPNEELLYPKTPQKSCKKDNWASFMANNDDKLSKD